MKKTLQEWADFLDMYVFMDPNGSVRATSKKPHISGSFDKTSYRNKSIRSVEIYWEVNEENGLVEIPKEAVNYDEFTLIPIENYKTSYYIGWDSSLRSPNSKKNKNIYVEGENKYVE